MSGKVSRQALNAFSASFVGPLAPQAPSAASPQMPTENGFGSQTMVGDAWTPVQASFGVPLNPQPVVPLSPPLQSQALLSGIGQLLAYLGTMAQQGVSVTQQFCQTVANFFSHQPSLPPGPVPKGPSPHDPTRFVLSSFNVLSSPAGNGKGYAPGPTRMHAVADILRANQVSVVGLQEVEQDQLAEFRKVAGDEYGTFAGESGLRGYHDTALAWRKDTWDLVKAATITVPSYEGRASKAPYVLLRNKQTGQEAYFIDAHNPANTRRHHHQEGYRDAAARQEAALAKQLREQSGLPVFIVGDMNSVREAQDIFTSGAPVKAASPRQNSGIDWIFGTKDVQFDQFRRARNSVIARTTDHPVAFTEVTIGEK